MSDEPTTPTEDGESQPRVVEVKPPLRQRFLRGLLLVWLVLVVVFSLANLHWVDFDWIVGSTEVVEAGGDRLSGGVPLILLLTGAFATGLLTGMTIVGIRARRARKAARDR